MALSLNKNEVRILENLVLPHIPLPPLFSELREATWGFTIPSGPSTASSPVLLWSIGGYTQDGLGPSYAPTPENRGNFFPS